MKLLLVEDEEMLSKSVAKGLRLLGYAVDCAYDGEEALYLYELNQYDLMILDLNLPKLDGIEVLRSIRREDDTFRVLILSARDSLEDKVQGLDSGSNDYLTKPFSVEELLARLRVTLRRLNYMNAQEGTSSVFINGDLRVDYASGCAYLKEQELHLTPIEYKLLCLLSRNVGKVLTHTYITNEIWGSAWDNDVASLRVFMATLRKKIESDTTHPQYIQTHVGVGYRMLRIE